MIMGIKGCIFIYVYASQQLQDILATKSNGKTFIVKTEKISINFHTQLESNNLCNCDNSKVIIMPMNTK